MLMQLDERWPTIKTISYTNQFLLDFCDSYLLVRFTHRSDLKSQFNSMFKYRSTFDLQVSDALFKNRL